MPVLAACMMMTTTMMRGEAALVIKLLSSMFTITLTNVGPVW
jgi:hypothetical protein